MENGRTVTVNVALTGLLASLGSVAVQVTVVVPTGKVDPGEGTHDTVGVGDCPDESVAVGSG